MLPKERSISTVMTIRKAELYDLARIAEIEVFNYRLNFYHIFKNDYFYFQEMQVLNVINEDKRHLDQLWVYDDDGIIKAFMWVDAQQIKKLFVEPVLQSQGIGSELLTYAVKELEATYLWALEKNTRAINFYKRHGFQTTEERMLEEDTTEYLVKLIKTRN